MATIPGLSAILSGLKIAELITKVQTANLANIKTIAFQASTVETTDLFYTQLKKAGIFENSDALKRPVPVEIGSGAKVVGIYKILTQGDPRVTNNPLDLMITGPGYFAMGVPTAPNGRAFTRNGQFHIDPTSRKLVNFDGDPLLDDISIPINVDVSTVQISRDGVVTGVDNTNAQVAIGQLTLWTFPNVEGLSSQGKSLAIETEGSGDGVQIDNLVNKFLSGNLEDSNISMIEGLANMMEAQKMYDILSRALSMASDNSKTVAEAA